MDKGLYRHFKGTIYKVLGTAIHTETLEKLVLYSANIGKVANGGYEIAIYARPFVDFTGFVELNGKKIRRFEKVDGDEKV